MSCQPNALSGFIVQVHAGGTVTNYVWNGIDTIGVGNLKTDCIRVLTNAHYTLKSVDNTQLIECVHQNETTTIHADDGTVFPFRTSSCTVFLYKQGSNPIYSIDLQQKSSMTLGRQNSDILLTHRSVSRSHALIRRISDDYWIEDIGSTNGTYVNGTAVTKVVLHDNDVITIGKYTLIFHGDALLVSESPADVKAASQEDDNQPFNRSPRMRKPTQKGAFSLQKPPAIGSAPEVNWLSVLLPPILMFVVAIGMSVITGGIGMLIMLPLQIASVILAIVNYKKQKKKFTDLEVARKEKYDEYLAEVRKNLETAANNQLSNLTYSNPETKECLSIVTNKAATLWERWPDDEDFTGLRLGVGDIRADLQATWQDNSIVLQEDELESAAKQLIAEHEIVHGAPIIVNARDNRVIGIAGKAEATTQLALNMIVQAATFHSYEELKIAVVFPEDRQRDWQWIRWLPHVEADADDYRFLACTNSAASILKEKLKDIITSRKKDDYGSYVCKAGDPHYLLVVAAPTIFNGADLLNEIISAEKDVGVSIIYMAPVVSQLPKECRSIVEVTNNSGEVYAKSNASNRSAFSIDVVEPADFDNFGRTMAGIRLSEKQCVHSIPDSVTFMEGFGLHRIEDYDIESAWNNARADKTMSVPIGIDESGNTFYFDVMDGRHGVHGLVGGMPGSGKSEMLQSWLLSMAMHFSPQDISFALIDFKGTGLITPFNGLPHLAGSISNIDTEIDIQRKKESLEYEIKRREKLFDQYGVSNIKAYIKGYNEGRIPEKLPILFVVIDEFAEFKKAFPEFMKWVESSFAKGRSEGIWFILSTQQPGNETSPAIKDNTHYKWCLKVASPSVSKEMVGIPDAARFTHPGRAYVKVSNSTSDFLTLIQSFWSGAQYAVSGDDSKKIEIRAVDLTGNRSNVNDYIESTTGLFSQKNQIDVIVRYITRYADEHNIPHAQKVWEDRLKDRLYLTDVARNGFDGASWPEAEDALCPIVGEVDDPKHQRKFPLEIAFSEYGHIAVSGAPTTGKTTFLQTLVMSLALTYTPDEVSIYVMDFGSMGMRAFSQLPHVGGIAELGDDERVMKLAQLLTDELTERKNKFAQAGVGSIKAYQETGAEKIPYIVLAVDNFHVMQHSYPDLEGLFTTLFQSGANYGIYCALTATGVNGVGYRYQQNIKMTFALQLADKSDYNMLVGRTEGLVPENVMGRGLMKATPPLQFQTALPAFGESDSEIFRNVVDIAEQMNAAWTGKRAAPIPMMPERIDYGDIPGSEVYIGLSYATVQPLAFDYTKQHYLMISGTTEDDRLGILRSVSMQLHTRLGGRLITFASDAKSLSVLKEQSDVYLSTAVEIDEFIEGFRGELQQRDAASSSERQLFENIVVVVDDFNAFFNMISNDTASRIRAIILKGAALKTSFITSCDAMELSVLKNKGEMAATALTKGEFCILQGGCLNEHGAYQPKASYSQKSITVKADEGFLLQDGDPVRCKFMELKG